MIYSRGEPAHYAGKFDARKSYDGGAIVYDDGYWWCSKSDGNKSVPTGISGSWAKLGAIGAIPTQVVHRWHPRTLQYPCDDDNQILSAPVDVCSDCWADADLKNAFDPRAHLYVIQEPEAALGI